MREAATGKTETLKAEKLKLDHRGVKPLLQFQTSHIAHLPSYIIHFTSDIALPPRHSA
jgi:hypothetical protein